MVINSIIILLSWLGTLAYIMYVATVDATPVEKKDKQLKPPRHHFLKG